MRLLFALAFAIVAFAVPQARATDFIVRQRIVTPFVPLVSVAPVVVAQPFAVQAVHDCGVQAFVSPFAVQSFAFSPFVQRVAVQRVFQQRVFVRQPTVRVNVRVR